MSVLRKRNLRRDNHTWPGFVDALATLLMVVIFVLMIFSLAQFYLNQVVSGQDEALISLNNKLVENENSILNLNQKIIEISDMLLLEKKESKKLSEEIIILKNNIAEGNDQIDLLSQTIASLNNEGAMGVVVPHGVLFRGSSEKAIRKGILDDDLFWEDIEFFRIFNLSFICQS